MFAFKIGEQQRLGNPIEHIGGRRATPTLLQPGVPGGTDIGALCDFFAAQPRRTASLRRETEGRGIKLGAAIFEIGAQQRF